MDRLGEVGGEVFGTIKPYWVFQEKVELSR